MDDGPAHPSSHYAAPTIQYYDCFCWNVRNFLGSEIYTQIKYFEKTSCLKCVGSPISFLHIPPVLAQPLKIMIQIL